MKTLEICFCLLAGLVVYTYVGYPLLLLLLARFCPRKVHREEVRRRSVSVVLAVYNEEASIGRRLQELIDLINNTGVTGEVIVVSDGSTDGTAAIARTFTKGAVRVIELPENMGKAEALTRGCAVAQHEILVFADARQSWAPNVLSLLLENFDDPEVGAVSGDLVVETAPGVMAGIGFYWRYEKWLRRRESWFHSMVSVTGAISAVRRELFHPIPQGTLLDDVYWPLRVAMRGYRVIHDTRAKAYDRLPEKVADEFRRKVRTLAGNYQLLTVLPSALLPWRNPIWLQLLSHKVLRLFVPWALLGLLGLSLLLGGWFFLSVFACQAAFYLLALIGLHERVGTRFRLASAAASFLVLNTAAWLAFWKWSLGRAGECWGKVLYGPELVKLPNEHSFPASAEGL